MPSSDEFVEDHNEEISMRASEDGEIHHSPGCKGFVQTDAEVPFSAQKEEDEDSDVYQSYLRRVISTVIQMVQNGNQDVQHITGLEDKVHELLVVVTHLPEKDQQLLVDLDLLVRVRDVGLKEWIVQQSSESLHDEGEVFLSMDPCKIVDEQIVMECCINKHARIFLVLMRVVVVKSDDQQLNGDFHQWFPCVVEQEMVEGKDPTWSVRGECVEERCEERKSVSILRTGEEFNPLVGRTIRFTRCHVHRTTEASEEQAEKLRPIGVKLTC